MPATRSCLNRSTIHLVLFFLRIVLTNCKDNRTNVSQNIVNRSLVFTGGFHTDLSTVMVKEPFFQSLEVRIERGEAFFYISSNATVVCESDGSDHKFFMDVHAAADKVFHR